MGERMNRITAGEIGGLDEMCVGLSVEPAALLVGDLSDDVKITKRHAFKIVASADCGQDLHQVPLLQCQVLEDFDFPDYVLAFSSVEPFAYWYRRWRGVVLSRQWDRLEDRHYGNPQKQHSANGLRHSEGILRHCTRGSRSNFVQGRSSVVLTTG